jgi:amino acid permease
LADGLPGCSASQSRVSAASAAAMPYMKGVMNTANSLVGSSMLAMPFVLSKCGIILGFVVIIVCGLLCETSCHLLCVVTKASQRGSYEELGRAVFGSLGKRAVQLAMCLCMVNCMVVWFVVLGTILPRLAAEYGFIEAAGPEARMNVLFVVAACVVFPISLLKNVMGAIAMLSQISMAFYSCFALWTISLGGGAFAEMRWIKHVPWWDWEGLSTCVPIVSAALTAQTQFFMIYQNMPNNSISEMRSCVFWACVIVRVCCFPLFSCAYPLAVSLTPW